MSDHRLIEGLRVGDETVVLEFCTRYRDALSRLADRHLVPGLRRRLDPEDVVQSVFRTFFRRASEGQFDLPDGEALWRLLCAITLAKTREQARFARRQKRDAARDVALDGEDLRTAAAMPLETAAFVEQFDRVLEAMDDEERQVVALKLRDQTNERIAESVLCSERTVCRILERMRRRLEHTLADGG